MERFDLYPSVIDVKKKKKSPKGENTLGLYSDRLNAVDMKGTIEEGTVY